MKLMTDDDKKKMKKPVHDDHYTGLAKRGVQKRCLFESSVIEQRREPSDEPPAWCLQAEAEALTDAASPTVGLADLKKEAFMSPSSKRV